MPAAGGVTALPGKAAPPRVTAMATELGWMPGNSTSPAVAESVETEPWEEAEGEEAQVAELCGVFVLFNGFAICNSLLS